MTDGKRFRPWDGPLQRVFRGEVDRAVAEAAVKRGLVTVDQFAEALGEAEASAGDVTAVLLERGWLDAATVAALEEGFAREAFLRAHARPAREELPPEVQQASADPQRHLAEFVLVTPIGQGGTGRVWK